MATAFADFGRSIRPHGAWVAKRLRQVVSHWLTRRRERLALAELDDRLLRDIGIDRLTALREAERPFWDGGERHSGRRGGRWA
jgi:uncharacterized protein YjiS (DUF1127 family)